MESKTHHPGTAGKSGLCVETWMRLTGSPLPTRHQRNPGRPGNCWAAVILKGWRKHGRGACLSWPSLVMTTTPVRTRRGLGLLTPERVVECLPSAGHTQVREMVRLPSPKHMGQGVGRERERVRE